MKRNAARAIRRGAQFAQFLRRGAGRARRLDGFQKGFVASGHTDCRAVLPTLTAPFMTIFSTHDEQFFKRKDVEAYHAKVGSDLIGEANEELVVWETDAEGGKCGHMVPFENPKEFVACVVRNIAKAKTENV